jgi:hypothetical protein
MFWGCSSGFSYDELFACSGPLFIFVFIFNTFSQVLIMVITLTFPDKIFSLVFIANHMLCNSLCMWQSTGSESANEQ